MMPNHLMQHLNNQFMNINMNGMKSPEYYQFIVKEMIDGSLKNMNLVLSINYFEMSTEVTTRVKEIC